jgi:hypothetical protein
MKTFRRLLPVILSASGFAVACIGTSVGCGGDDTSGTPAVDSGTDGTVETGDAAKEASTVIAPDGGDATLPDGGKSDTGVPDSGVDSGATDGAANAEVDADATAKDSGPEADGKADASADTGDGGVTFFDAGEGGLSVATYATEVARAYCQSIEKCCPAAPNGQYFSLNLCVATQSTTNFNQDVNLSDGGNVVLNLTKAQACLNDLASVNCSDVTTLAVTQQFTDCYGALVGTIQDGASCVSSIECSATSFCDLPLDGGAVGTCQPLRTAGESCEDFAKDPTKSEEACSHRGSGLGGLRCANEDLSTGSELDASAWVCASAVAPPNGCNVAVDCTTLLCDPGMNFDLYQCVTDQTFIYPSSCTSYYVDSDAGDGG